MAFETIGVGTAANDGTGDTPRAAFIKVNANTAKTVEGPASAVADRIAVFDGTTGKLLKDGGSLIGAVYLGETVAGGAGFVNVSGAVTLDLAGARVFHHTATGNMTGPTFTNVPDADTTSAVWQWVVKQDATGGRTLTSTPAVTFEDGSGFSSLNTAANAVTIFTFWRVGAVTHGTTITSGSLSLDPYTMTFPAAGTLLIAVARAEDIDLSDVTHLEADGTAGTGTLTYKKNGGANLSTTSGDNPTSFAAGEVLSVILTSSTTASAVSIPRFA